MDRLPRGIMGLAPLIALLACSTPATPHFHARDFDPARTRGQRVALVLIEDPDHVPRPDDCGFVFGEVGRPCIDEVFPPERFLEEATAQLRERGLIVVNARRAEDGVDPVAKAFREAAESGYQPSPETREALSSEAQRQGADLVVLLFQPDTAVDVASGSVRPPPLPTSTSSPTIPGSGPIDAQAGGIYYGFTLEVGLFEAGGAPLYHGTVSGGASQFLYFYKAAHRRAVSNTLENVAETLTSD